MSHTHGYGADRIFGGPVGKLHVEKASGLPVGDGTHRYFYIDGSLTPSYLSSTAASSTANTGGASTTNTGGASTTKTSEASSTTTSGASVTTTSGASVTTTSGTTATNQNTGGGQSHTNLPSYKNVYIWERVA